MAEKIRYEVDVDSSDAISGLRDFSRAAQKAGKDAAKGLDDAATAGDKARTAIKAMADAMDTELRGAAAAADALGKALGPELAGKMDVNQVVVDLERMGVTFDEIRLEADQFATTLRQVDDINLRQTTAGLDTMKTKLGDVRNNADQSRSVLANMAGNSAQDLGELGGVAGTAGVAIGQLAEYATEGNISLSAFAKVAGPMAGLAAATIIASNAMKFFQQDSKRSAEAVEAMNEAIIAGEDPLEAYTELLKEQGGILAGQRDQGVKELITDVIGLTDATEDLTPSLLAAGVTIDTWNTALEGGDAGRQQFVDGLTQMREEGHITQSEWYGIVNAFGDAADNFDTSTRQAGEAAQFFVTTQEDLNEILAASADPLTKHTELWDALIRDVADGTFNFENAADAVTILAEATGMTTEEIVELVKQKADEHIAEIAEAEKEAAAEALRLSQAIADLGDTMSTIDADDFANIGSALAGALDLGDTPIDFQSTKENLRDAFAELGTYLEENPVDIDWAKVLDTSQDTGLSSEVLNLVAGVRDTFQTGITDAFDIGGASAAQHFVDTFLPALTDLGMSPAQAYELLGLPADGSVTALIQPMVDAEAKADALAILDSLIGVDPNNPILAYMRLGVQTDEIPAQVAEAAAKILAGQALNVPAKLEEFSQADIDAAYALLAEQEVTVPTAADITGAQDDIGEAEDGDYQATIDADADTQVAARQLLDETTRQRQATIYAIAAITSAKLALDSLKAARTAPVYVSLPNIYDADAALATLARRRDAYLYVHTVSTGGGGGTTGGETPGTLLAPAGVGVAPLADGEDVGVTPFAAPAMSSVPSSGVAIVGTAPASTVNNNYVTVQAGIVGNKNEMDRIISKALRRHVRLNGSRN